MNKPARPALRRHGIPKAARRPLRAGSRAPALRAETTNDPEIRRQILAIAQQYEDLATTLRGLLSCRGPDSKGARYGHHAFFQDRGANGPDAPDGRRTLRALPPVCGSITRLGGERVQPAGSRRLDGYGIAI